MPLPVGMECHKEMFEVHGSMTEAAFGSMPLCQYWRIRPGKDPIPVESRASVRVTLDDWDDLEEMEELRAELIQKNHQVMRHPVILRKRGTSKAMLVVGCIKIREASEIVR